MTYRWPKPDLWTVLLVVIIAALILIFTFEIWVPHGPGHQQ